MKLALCIIHALANTTITNNGVSLSPLYLPINDSCERAKVGRNERYSCKGIAERNIGHIWHAVGFKIACG